MQNIWPFKALEDTSLCFRDRDCVHMSSWTPSLSHPEWSTRGSRFMIFLTPALLCLEDTASGSRRVFVAKELLSATNHFIFKEDQKVSSMPLFMSLCGRCSRADILQVPDILPVCCVVGVVISLYCCLYHPRQGGFVFWTVHCMSLLVMFVWHVLVLLLS